MPSNFTAFISDLYALEQELSQDKDPVQLGSEYMLDSFPDAPPGKPPGYTAWDSAKQIRWYFWAVQSGLLDNPYQRTGHLLNSQKLLPITETGDGLEGGVHNVYPNAVFIIGDANTIAEQAAIHEGRWWEFDAEVWKMTDGTLDIVEEVAFNKLVEKW